MANHQQFPEDMKFFPEHPPDEKTEQIQTTPSPLLEGQTAPFTVKELCDEFEKDFDTTLNKYVDKRFSVTGRCSCKQRTGEKTPMESNPTGWFSLSLC